MTDTPHPQDVEQNVENDHADAEVDADVVKREAGVRLRTNVQAGSASERVNVTAELHTRDMAELVSKLPSYRKVLGEQVEEARAVAPEANQ